MEAAVQYVTVVHVLRVYWKRESDPYDGKPQLLGVTFIRSEMFGSCSLVCRILFLSQSLQSL